MISGLWSWEMSPVHGATTANVERYIDFAAANGFAGVLTQGWNIGWDGAWNDMMFDQPTPDFDARALQRYARTRGVYLIGHHETGGAASRYDAQLERAFAYAREHDIPVVKTG